MTAQVRISGEPAEVEALVELLRGISDVDWDGRTYPNRRENGVRAYTRVQLPEDVDERR